MQLVSLVFWERTVTIRCLNESDEESSGYMLAGHQQGPYFSSRTGINFGLRLFISIIKDPVVSFS